MPPSSPGRSMPVRRRNRSAAPTCRSASAPSFRPIITEPTFDERARMSATVKVPPPPSCASPMVRSATWIVGGTANVVSGLDQVLLDRARDRDRLEGGAGLVGVLDRAVLARVGGRAVGVVGVHARPVGQRQHLARCAGRSRRRWRPAACRSGRPRRARPRCAPGCAASRVRLQVLARARARSTSIMLTGSPSASLTSRRSPSSPRELVLARVLEAGEALVVGADQAEHLRRRGGPADRCACGSTTVSIPSIPSSSILVAERGVHLARR